MARLRMLRGRRTASPPTRTSRPPTRLPPPVFGQHRDHKPANRKQPERRPRSKRTGAFVPSYISCRRRPSSTLATTRAAVAA